MTSHQVSRRDFSSGMFAAFPLLGLAARVFAQTNHTDAKAGVSHNNEAIHHEVIFQASRKRVYQALTDEKLFHQVTQLSADGKAMSAKAPTHISPELGGAFSLFGDHIIGRHVEMVPGERLVQAWRVRDWPPGIYSIVKFELDEQGAATRLLFDHAGFPQGLGQHLSDGWREHYWEPMQKLLS